MVEPQWYISRGGQVFGPHNQSTLNANNVVESDQLSQSPQGPWTPATAFPSLIRSNSKPEANEYNLQPLAELRTRQTQSNVLSQFSASPSWKPEGSPIKVKQEETSASKRPLIIVTSIVVISFILLGAILYTIIDSGDPKKPPQIASSQSSNTDDRTDLMGSDPSAPIKPSIDRDPRLEFSRLVQYLNTKTARVSWLKNQYPEYDPNYVTSTGNYYKNTKFKNGSSWELVSMNISNFDFDNVQKIGTVVWRVETKINDFSQTDWDTNNGLNIAMLELAKVEGELKSTQEIINNKFTEFPKTGNVELIDLEEAANSKYENATSYKASYYFSNGWIPQKVEVADGTSEYELTNSIKIKSFFENLATMKLETINPLGLEESQNPHASGISNTLGTNLSTQEASGNIPQSEPARLPSALARGMNGGERPKPNIDIAKQIDVTYATIDQPISQTYLLDVGTAVFFSIQIQQTSPLPTQGKVYWVIHSHKKGHSEFELETDGWKLPIKARLKSEQTFPKFNATDAPFQSFLVLVTTNNRLIYLTKPKWFEE